MTRSLSFAPTLLLVITLFQLVSSFHPGSYSFVAVAHSSASRPSSRTSTDIRDAPDTAVDYYGVLAIPSAFHFSSIERDAVNSAQPGAVVLTSGKHIYRSTVAADGSFVIRNLPFGSYLLQADWFDFVFPTIRVDVQWAKMPNQSTRVEITTYRNEYPVRVTPGTGLDEERPAVIATVGAVNYYVPREKVDIMKIVKSPVGIMGIVMVGMLLMMKAIPEEELKKAQAESKAMKKKIATAALEGTPLIDGGTKKKKKN